jgi:hypothetical protein
MKNLIIIILFFTITISQKYHLGNFYSSRNCQENTYIGTTAHEVDVCYPAPNNSSRMFSQFQNNSFICTFRSNKCEGESNCQRTPLSTCSYFNKPVKFNYMNTLPKIPGSKGYKFIQYSDSNCKKQDEGTTGIHFMTGTECKNYDSKISAKTFNNNGVLTYHVYDGHNCNGVPDVMKYELNKCFGISIIGIGERYVIFNIN